MKADEYAIENAMQLETYCESHMTCEDCVFHDDEGFLGKCRFTASFPQFWSIEKLKEKINCKG